jgi:hypothetical protein
VLETYGFIGVYLYSELKTNLKYLRITKDNFLTKMLRNYLNLCEKSDNDSVIKLFEFIECLPTLENISILIKERLNVVHEYIIIKIILDIYKHFLNKYNSLNIDKIQKLLSPAIESFYNSISQENLIIMNKKIYSIPELSDIISK